MFLVVRGPMGHCEEVTVSSMGMSLGALLPYKLELVLINGRPVEQWQEYIPQRGDKVEVTCGAADFGISAAAVASATAGAISGTAATVTAAVLNAIIALSINAALSQIMRALTPKPKKPKAVNRAEAFGIAGFNNTTGPGTPKFTPYGLNKVRGHVIASGANLSPDGTQMWGRVLYFMGWMSEDGCESIGEVEIDETSVAQFEEVVVHTRTGTGNTVIPEFENVDNIFTPTNQALDFNPDLGTGTPLTYTTHASTVERLTLFFSFPGGLYRMGNTGKLRQAAVTYKIEIKPNAGSTWTELTPLKYADTNTSGKFFTHQIDFPSANKWDIRITVLSFENYTPGEPYVADSLLFNVQETQFTTRSYPGWALLGLTNIPSKKVRSFESMNVSAIMQGKRIKIPGPLGMTLAFGRQRCWIVRDMMTHPVIGMGYEFSESEIDDVQWNESQNYYDEMVPGLPGEPNEVRDQCDFILNDLDWDWEWIKKVAGEARGRIVPSGDKWKYVIDRPGTPNLLYTEGANIIENSVQQEISLPDRPYSHISAQFRNAEKDYEPDYAPPIADPEALSAVMNTLQYDTITRESEIQRENLIAFKRNFLERRRWSFMSPMNAIVSEPMDLDYFAERSLGGEGGYGGFLPGGLTVFTINLPEVIKLEPFAPDGVTPAVYALIVKHKQDNTIEYRTVSTGAGNWGQVSVSTPFIQVPDEGDVYALGIEQIDTIVTRAQELEIDRDGRVRQVRTEYIPAIYSQDPLPPKSSRRFFGPSTPKPPIPLRAASVSEQVVINADGSARSTLIFDVTPGLPIQSGISQGGTVDYIVLNAGEPETDSYFNTAKITVGNDVRTVNSYFGIARPGVVAKTTYPTVPFSAAAAHSTPYTITWERYGQFGGFSIEISEDQGATFNPFVGIVSGTHFETDSHGAGPGPVFFRFTPVSIEGVENAVARLVIGAVLTGDTSAPAPPSSVTISSYLLVVRVVVTMALPMAADFNGVEIELYRTSISGNPIAVAQFGAPSRGASPGVTSINIEASFNLGAKTPPEAYGTVIWARARSVDFSRNVSGWTQSAQPTTLAPDPAATGGGVGPPAIPTGLDIIPVTPAPVDPFDGTVKSAIDIVWFANTEADMNMYEVQFREQRNPPAITLPWTVRMVSHPQISIREYGVVGGVVYEARIQAIDLTNNKSGFSAIVTDTTGRDATPPPVPIISSIIGGFRSVSIAVQPGFPSVADFKEIIIYRSTFNDWTLTPPRGTAGTTTEAIFTDSGLGDETTYYYWVKARDTSGNESGIYPGVTSGVPVATRKIGPDAVVTSLLITNAAQIGQAIINDGHILNLSANKILTGTLQANVEIGVGNNLWLLGDRALMYVADENGTQRVVIGRLGPAATDYGIHILGPSGELMWLLDGAQTQGIALNAVTLHSEFRDASIHTMFAFPGAPVATLVFASTGNTVIAAARIKVEKDPQNPFQGSPFTARLVRDGVTIDSVTEYTSQGKHFFLYVHDPAPPGTHTYALWLDSATPPSLQYGAMFISCLEQKR